ncbi:MAG: signal peptidase I [Gemmatimonadaceae bacterium]|nr:signal peptidase I [Gemmatimonadaceae bacterium]
MTSVPGSPPDAELRASALRAANGRTRAPRALRLSWLWEWAKVFPAAVLLFLVLHTFFVEAYKIPSGSMERTLLVGDFLLVNKLVYGAEIPFSGRRLPAIRTPQPGDVVVFEFPVDPSKNFVKRLVGVAGDTLSMHDGTLVRNGLPQDERYVVHTEPGVDPVNDEFRWQSSHLVKTAVAADADIYTAGLGYRPSRNNWGPLVVPMHHFFVLGDNRDNSLDSRYWGFVPDSLLRGTPLFVYYSFSPDSTVSAPWLTRIRWARVGTVVH